jgi:glycosyltransferase involved in cell wall biosynthesis
MKILMVHDYYSIRGGEDSCFEREMALLERKNVEVIGYSRRNTDDTAGSLSWNSKLALGIRTIWSHSDYQALRQLICTQKPDLMHVQNSFPLISPSAYYAAHHEDIPVIQTLHNYRLICPSAVFMRENKICEDCAHKTFPWPAVFHSCYSHGRAATAVTSSMIAVHRALNTWRDVVDGYIAQSEFMRSKFIECGLPARKVFLKAGFVYPDPGEAFGSGDYAIFVGRLAPEKGVDVLLKAWERTKQPWPLKIIGEGPLDASIRASASRIPGVEVLGRVSNEELDHLRRNARFQIVPSIWYEGAPAVILEAFAIGLPIVASRIGSLATMIDHSRTGLHFEAGNAADLAAQADRMFLCPAELAWMRRNARTDFLNKYTADESFTALMDVYAKVISANSAAVLARAASDSGLAG